MTQDSARSTSPGNL